MSEAIVGKGRGHRRGPPPPKSLTDPGETISVENSSILEISLNLDICLRNQFRGNPKVFKQGAWVIFSRDLAPIKCRHNPFRVILEVVTRHSDYRIATMTSLPAQILENFQSWSNSNDGLSMLSGLVPPHELKREVFDKFAKVRNTAFAFKAFAVFQVSEIRQHLRPQIVTFMNKDVDYKRAAEIIIFFNLQSEFSLEETVIPMILTSVSGPILNDYLKGTRSTLLKLVTWLDELDVYRLNETSRNYPQLNKQDKSRLTDKALKRFIDSLVTQFDLDGDEVAPKHFYLKRRGDLRYLVGDNSPMRPEHRRNLVEKRVGVNAQLQKDLLLFLTDGKTTDYNFKEAAYWAKKFQTVPDDMPYQLKVYLEEEDENLELSEHAGMADDWEDDWSSNCDVKPLEKKFHLFPLPQNMIVMVDSVEGFDTFTRSISTEFLVGIDCEFTSSMEKPKVALMQVATKTRVYLLDMGALTKSVDEEKWNSFATTFFLADASDNMILGYGLRNDYQTLANTLPCFKDLVSPKKIRNVLDIEMFARRLTTGFEKVIDPPNDSHEKGLAGLTEKMFGHPLDKRDQRSDWEKRPLTSQQLTYAALDAYVLIQLYEIIYDMAMKTDPGADAFNKLESYLRKSQNKPPKTAKKANLPAQAPLAMSNISQLSSTPIDPPALKVVCDNMLQGLCKKLRMLGIDAVAIESFEHFETCGKRAETEGRKILTRSGHHKRLSEFVPFGHCLPLRQDKPEDQIAEVLHYFNIRDTQEYVFTRCLKCNGDEYAKLPRERAVELGKNMGLFSSNPTTILKGPPISECDEDSDVDDYSRFKDPTDSEDSSDGMVCQPRGDGARSTPSLDMQEQWFGDVNLKTGLTRRGVLLKLAAVPCDVFQKQDTFYGCCQCGHIYWEGSHWDRVLGRVGTK